jgi:hypothetical protein
VLADREIVPGAVRREYVEDMIKDHAEQVDAHNADADTFELPWRPGTIYKPDAECMFRVLGIPPANISDNTIITTGRYESACNRQPESIEPTKARIGIDVARYGTDNGTIYVRHDGRIWRHKQISGQDTNTYRAAIIELCEWLQAQGVTDLQIRVDGGGGYASGIIDPLRIDMGFQAMFKTVNLYEVHNNGEPTNKAKYADKVTEMYAESAETMNGYAVVKPPPQLEQDLTDRRYGFANKSGVTVRRLEEKDLFKKRNDRSPDDGDGFVLSASPDHIFAGTPSTPFVQGSAKIRQR